MIRKTALVVALLAASVFLMGQSECDPPEASVELTSTHDGELIVVAHTMQLGALLTLPAGATVDEVQFTVDQVVVGTTGPPQTLFLFNWLVDTTGFYGVQACVDYTRMDSTVGSVCSLTTTYEAQIPGPACLVDIGGHCLETLISDAQDMWQIGLPPLQYASARIEVNGVLVPPHWITASCASPGLSPTQQGFCVNNFNNGLLGYNFVRTDFATGEILESTTVINPSYITQPFFRTNTERREIIAHEIGHGLGLRHTQDVANIMYPSGLRSSVPSAAELAVMDETYLPPALPSQATIDAYFNVGGGAPLPNRHFSIPQFTLDNSGL